MNGQLFLIYTTRQGGFFKAPVTENGVICKTTREEYDEILRTRQIDVTPPDVDVPPEGREYVTPTLVMLARIEENHDFALGRSRESAAV